MVYFIGADTVVHPGFWEIVVEGRFTPGRVYTFDMFRSLPATVTHGWLASHPSSAVPATAAAADTALGTSGNSVIGVAGDIGGSTFDGVDLAQVVLDRQRIGGTRFGAGGPQGIVDFLRAIVGAATVQQQQQQIVYTGRVAAFFEFSRQNFTSSQPMLPKPRRKAVAAASPAEAGPQLASEEARRAGKKRLKRSPPPQLPPPLALGRGSVGGGAGLAPKTLNSDMDGGSEEPAAVSAPPQLLAPVYIISPFTRAHPPEYLRRLLASMRFDLICQWILVHDATEQVRAAISIYGSGSHPPVDPRTRHN